MMMLPTDGQSRWCTMMFQELLTLPTLCSKQMQKQLMKPNDSHQLSMYVFRRPSTPAAESTLHPLQAHLLSFWSTLSPSSQIWTYSSTRSDGEISYPPQKRNSEWVYRCVYLCMCKRARVCMWTDSGWSEWDFPLLDQVSGRPYKTRPSPALSDSLLPQQQLHQTLLQPSPGQAPLWMFSASSSVSHWL